ncbi:hypothetical protein ACEPAG_8935 [Sanghuangporus baumii]
MSSATARRKYNPVVRIARKVLDDDMGTRTRFFDDTAGTPEDISCTHQVDSQAGPKLYTHDSTVVADGMDGHADPCDMSTPKADSESESFVFAIDSPDDISDTAVGHRARSVTSSHVSGTLAIGQWTRRAPFVPNMFANAPGSDVATEVATGNDIVPVPESIRSYRSASHFSGTTQPPDSEGHAGPRSTYFVYQESGMRTFECEDPRTVTRARGKLGIERCYATENNLGLSRKARETFDAQALSAAPGSRFSSPTPSCQMPPPSLHLREQTPFSETSDSLAQHRGPTPEPTFDYVRWRWNARIDKNFSTDSSFASSDTLVAADDQGHGSADFDHAAYCKLFGREGSPLTELPEESDPDETRNKPTLPGRVLEEGQMRLLKNCRVTTRPSTPRSSQRLALRTASERTVKHQVTPYKSPAENKSRVESMVTRRRGKQSGANRPVPMIK